MYLAKIPLANSRLARSQSNKKQVKPTSPSAATQGPTPVSVAEKLNRQCKSTSSHNAEYQTLIFFK